MSWTKLILLFKWPTVFLFYSPCLGSCSFYCKNTRVGEPQLDNFSTSNGIQMCQQQQPLYSKYLIIIIVL